jgi:glycosyltransferase involved in cell wall biosynthesis
MPDQPKVSIVIPVYNGSNYLRTAIESALNQTYQNIEVIVVDDGSNDGEKTRKIAESFGDRIRFFTKQNGGCGSALNLGIEHMRGELFSWLSHDDLYLPKKIERQVNKYLAQVNPDSIIFSGYISKDGKNRRLGSTLPHRYLIPPQLEKPLYPLLRGLVHGCTLLIPRSAFDKVGLFDEGLRTTQDYALWFEFFRRFPLIYDDHVNVIARTHPDQDTQKINDLHLREANELWLGFAEKLTCAEKTCFDGTEYKFLSNLATYLEITPFDKAKIAIQNMAKQLIKNLQISVILIIDSELTTQEEITRSISSIANQTHENCELIIICNRANLFKSIDLTLDSLPKLNVYCLLNEEKTLSILIDECISNAQGKYTAFLNAPDTFFPTKLEDQLISLEYQGSNFLGSNYVVNGEADTKIEVSLEESCGNIFPQILRSNAIALSTIICHTQTLQNIACLQSYGEAWYARILIWLSCSYPFTSLPKTLVHVSSQHYQELERNFLNSFAINSDIKQLISSQEFFNAFRALTFENGTAVPIATFEQFTNQLFLAQTKDQLNLEVFSYTPPMINVEKKLQTYGDYEGFIVQNLKHRIPTPIWVWSTKLYRIIRNGVYLFLKGLGMIYLIHKIKEKIQSLKFSYQLYKEENFS